MKTCKDFEDMIEKYIDNELEENEMQILKKHLEECLACNEMFEFSKALRAGLKNLDRPVPPVDFVSRVNMKINEEAKKDNGKKGIAGFWKSKSMQSLAACLLLAVFLGWGGEFVNNFDDKTENDFEKIRQQTVVSENSSEVLMDNATIILSEKDEVSSSQETKEVDTGEKQRKENKAKNTAKPKKTEEVFEQIQKKDSAVEGDKPEQSPAAVEIKEETEENFGTNIAQQSLPETEELKLDEKIDDANQIQEQQEPQPAFYAVSGGGGNSRAVNESTQKPINGSFAVAVDKLSEVKNIALNYGSFEDGVYGMNSEKFSEFLQKLDLLEISYSCDFEADGGVRFIIVEE